MPLSLQPNIKAHWQLVKKKKSCSPVTNCPEEICCSTFCLCKHDSAQVPERGGTRDSAPVEEYYRNGCTPAAGRGGGVVGR